MTRSVVLLLVLSCFAVSWSGCGSDSGEASDPCTPTAVRCAPDDPLEVQQCNDDAKWETLEVCPGGLVCDTDGCAQTCPEGERRCAPDTEGVIQECLQEGYWNELTTCAAGEPCVGGQCDPWKGPAETNDWRILFNYRGRIVGQNDDQNELWMMQADGSNPESLTDLGGLKNLDPPLSCNFGCVVSPDLKWIAVVVGPPTASGFELKLGKFNASLEVVLVKGKKFENIVDFKFAGDRIFYTQQKTCQGAACQYDLFVVELADNVNQSTQILTFPPDADLGDSTYRGHFKVSADGKKIIMLNTTIRSVEPFMWKDGSGLISLDFVCKFGTKGDCSGTGSEYTDLDPVAIDPTGRWVVFFTFSDRWQRARIYDTENPGQIQLAIIASVAQGSYIERACDQGVLADWQWQRVVGNPWFTPDSDSVVFLTQTACTSDGSQPRKPRTNIRRIKLDTLLSGKTLEPDDVLNLTNNPFGDVTNNRRTTGFFVSPDGATVVFTASPELDQGGNVIGDGTARQRNDREVYRMTIKGEGITQISNDISFQAESPLLIPGTGQ